MNTIYYKFKNNDQIYKGRSPCTRHFNDSSVWNMQLPGIIPVEQEFQKLSYMEKGMLAYSLADVEWMEYRVVSPEDHLNRVAEDWSNILINSPIGKYIILKDRVAHYRFTTNDPYRRVMFILALMRYIEEEHKHVSSILNNEKLEGINNDQLIAVVSAYLSAVGNSNHTMFYPPTALLGLFHYLPEVYEAMLTSDCKPVLDSKDWDKFNASSVVLSKFNHGMYKKGFFNSFSKFEDTDTILKHFNREIKVA
ncbi:MAG: hypothetical protein H6961_10695 [Chromatiaceae bacterium]|nr:hypothetical protein [Chromatiaceae bacterium]